MNGIVVSYKRSSPKKGYLGLICEIKTVNSP